MQKPLFLVVRKRGLVSFIIFMENEFFQSSLPVFRMCELLTVVLFLVSFFLYMHHTFQILDGYTRKLPGPCLLFPFCLKAVCNLII